jgi:hypothetical protein
MKMLLAGIVAASALVGVTGARAQIVYPGAPYYVSVSKDRGRDTHY